MGNNEVQRLYIFSENNRLTYVYYYNHVEESTIQNNGIRKQIVIQNYCKGIITKNNNSR